MQLCLVVHKHVLRKLDGGSHFSNVLKQFGSDEWFKQIETELEAYTTKTNQVLQVVTEQNGIQTLRNATVIRVIMLAFGRPKTVIGCLHCRTH